MVIPGLFAWFDAADLSTIVESAGLVSIWNDKSGNNFHATQSIGSRKPTTGASQFAGKNVIDFLGGDCFSLPSGTNLLPNSNNSIICVVKTTGGDGSNEQRIISGIESSSTRYVLLLFPTTPPAVLFLSRTSIGPGVVKSGVVVNVPTIFTGMLSGTTQSISINNGAAETNNSGAYENGISEMTIGAFGSSATLTLYGAIAELLLYSRALSANELSRINRYLANKWGLPA